MKCRVVSRPKPGLKVSVCADEDEEDRAYFFLDQGRKQLAALEALRIDTGPHARNGPVLVSDSAHVADPKNWSKGFGTMLYEAGLKLACEEGRAFRSSSTRSVFSESFWRKQADKGRAVCVADRPGFYHRLPLEVDLEEAHEAGELDTATYEAIRARVAPLAEEARAAKSDWRCNHYRIDNACLTPTLKGLRGRKGKRGRR